MALARQYRKAGVSWPWTTTSVRGSSGSARTVSVTGCRATSGTSRMLRTLSATRSLTSLRTAPASRLSWNVRKSRRSCPSSAAVHSDSGRSRAASWKASIIRPLEKTSGAAGPAREGTGRRREVRGPAMRSAAAGVADATEKVKTSPLRTSPPRLDISPEIQLNSPGTSYATTVTRAVSPMTSPRTNTGALAVSCDTSRKWAMQVSASNALKYSSESVVTAASTRAGGSSGARAVRDSTLGFIIAGIPAAPRCTPLRSGSVPDAAAVRVRPRVVSVASSSPDPQPLATLSGRCIRSAGKKVPHHCWCLLLGSRQAPSGKTRLRSERLERMDGRLALRVVS